MWLGFAPHDHHGEGQANPVPARTSSWRVASLIRSWVYRNRVTSGKGFVEGVVELFFDMLCFGILFGAPLVTASSFVRTTGGFSCDG